MAVLGGAEKLGMEVCYWADLLPRGPMAAAGAARSWENLCRQMRPDAAAPYRIRLVGVGEKSYADFLCLSGDIPDDGRFVFVSDDSWQVAVVVNRRSLREVRDFFASFPPESGRGEYFVRGLPSRVWPSAGAVGVYIFGRR